jgi:hypothetical protein
MAVLGAAWTVILLASVLAEVIHPFAFVLGLVLGGILGFFALLDWRTFVEVDQRGIAVLRWRRTWHPWGVVQGVSSHDGWVLRIIDGDDVALPPVDDLDVLLDTIALAIGADRPATA